MYAEFITRIVPEEYKGPRRRFVRVFQLSSNTQNRGKKAFSINWLSCEQILPIWVARAVALKKRVLNPHPNAPLRDLVLKLQKSNKWI